MGQACHCSQGLTRSQADTVKLSVSAACRKMSADQILDLADHLHDIIRKRGERYGADELAVYDPGATSGVLAGELSQ